MESAYHVARNLLADRLPRRWAHVQAVANVAERLAQGLGTDGDLLVAAAWLHDVGYSPGLARTAFHPLDGARYLQACRASRRLIGLVAFHSSSAAEADASGLGEQLAEFEDERTLVRDLLWYCDMTTGPDGQRMSFDERMSDVRERYPVDHYVIRALDAGMDERRGAIARAEAWMREVGIEPQV